jgi:DNA-binding CsgD family transcriptional regulator
MAELVPYAAAAVSYVEPDTGTHRLLANRGYAPGVIDYLLSDFIARDRGWRHAVAEPERILCWRDVPGYRHAYSARRVFSVHGYDEGTSVCLRGPAGELAGALHVSVREAELPDSSRESIAILRGSFARLAATGAARASSRLSAREAEVLRFVARGMSNSEIAERLVLARRTVATHVEHILHKLGARNRIEASVLALRLGLD